MKRSNELNVNGTIVRVIRHNEADYVCITDIAALKNPIEPKDVVKNWMRSRATISFLGFWEKLHNPDFKGVDFDPLLSMAEQPQRLKKLNEIAIQQMRILLEVDGIKFLK